MSQGADPLSRSLFWRSRIRAAFCGRPRAAISTRVIGAVLGAAAFPTFAHGVAIDSSHEIRTAESTTTSQSASLRRQVVTEALRYRGVPYVWGGSTPAGFDCSGFTAYVYAKFGTQMAHSTYAQYDSYRHVTRTKLRPGDLVFFSGVGHVGIYIGHGRFVHSPRSGKSVEVQKLSSSWYRESYVGAVRPPLTATAVA